MEQLDRTSLAEIPQATAPATIASRDDEARGVGTLNSLQRGLRLSLIAIIACVGVIISVVFYASSRIDAYASKESCDLVQMLVDEEIGDVAALSLEYGWWNEAVEAIVYQRDQEWAAVNVSAYLHDRYDIEWVLAFDTDGQLAHGMHDGELIQSTTDEIMTPALEELIERARITDFSDPEPQHGLISVNGKPAIAGVTTFAVYEPTEYDPNRSHGAIALIRNLSEDLLATWSSAFQLEGLAFVSADAEESSEMGRDPDSIQLTAVDGLLIGTLRWRSRDAGGDFLSLVLPWVLSGSALILLFGVLFQMKLRQFGAVAYRNFSDLITSRKALIRQAKYDYLTGLVNRALFVEIVRREIARCVRHETKAAVVYIDLDGFKEVNDTLGHSLGDELLVRVGDDLSDIVRREDTVARMGGDEFCLLLTNITNQIDVERVIEKIHARFAVPVSIADRRLVLGASVGIVMIPDDTTDFSNVFRFSDIAMYKAKSKGENGYCFYTPEMEADHEHRHILKENLAIAIDHDELYLNYQPIYALDDRAVTGLEALIRWKSKSLGDVSPVEFIPIAEGSGLIDRIGLWVFDRALADLSRFDRDIETDLTMSVNVSVKQLGDYDLPSKLDHLLAKHGVEASRIRLEITESLLINRHDTEHSVLLALSEKGFRLVLDDFGTGYSALGYLQRYPLETIKIDKSFISESEAGSSASLVKTIVYMAQTSGMATVAEGIETAEQEQFLRSINCTYGQGFHFGRPMAADRVVSLVKTSRSTLS